MTTPAETARQLLALGLAPIPVHPRNKKPVHTGWTTLRITSDSIDQYFNGGDYNVGVLLGEPSNWAVDVDLDTPEAINLAHLYLPATATFGRASKPRSHYVYKVAEPVETQRFQAPDGTVLLELRSTGAQTVFPASVHESGELIQWSSDCPAIANVAPDDLQRRLEWLAAAALLARHWPRVNGDRQERAMALAGALLNSAWPEANVACFVQSVAHAGGDDEETAMRAAAVVATAAKHEKGGAHTGWPTVAKFFGDQITDQVGTWFGFRHDPYSAGAGGEKKDTGELYPQQIGAVAFHGLAGEIVSLIAPHTESDPVALLAQLLIAVGNAAGCSAHFVAEADRHALNLYSVLVGQTSKGRKGTSWGHIRRCVRGVDESWEERIASGLSSGEGLIWHVRDPIEGKRPIKKSGCVTEYESVIEDHGVTDKRLLCFESEFASTLKVLRRDGNTLSPVLRNAWDTGDLQILTKNSPARATGAHISVIGHITREEPLRHLDSTEAANGFGNRFLWFCVKRARCLPEGGSVPDDQLSSLIDRLKKALAFARSSGELKRDTEARELWYEIYPQLSEGKPGLLGAMLARAEAQVMRIASIYAVLDCSNEIRITHLKAALEIWRYAEDSVRFIFGDSLGDPVADTILRHVRGSSNGLTRTDVSNIFARNASSVQIDRAVQQLDEKGLVTQEQEKSDGRGRPTMRIRAK